MKHTSLLSPEILSYIESVGIYGTHYGMPRSVARVMGLLLVCEPSYQPADEIGEKLQLSTGAVSAAMTMLLHIGLVRKRAFSGDRRTYYEIDSGGWRRVMQARLQSITDGARIAKEGLQVTPNNPRLRDMYRLYHMLEKEIDQVIKNMEEKIDDKD